MPLATLIAPNAPWQIPAYAHDKLIVQQATHHSQARGPRGEFALPTPATLTAPLTVRWGAPNGPPLAQLRLRGEPPSAHWDGQIVVGGAVGMFQVEVVRGLPLAMAHIEGALIASDSASPFSPQGELPPGPTETFTYTVAAAADSPFADYLFQAMALDLGTICTARLGPQEGGWHEVLHLPLLVEKVALLPAPLF